jgi:hypothetical protein
MAIAQFRQQTPALIEPFTQLTRQANRLNFIAEIMENCPSDMGPGKCFKGGLQLINIELSRPQEAQQPYLHQIV